MLSVPRLLLLREVAARGTIAAAAEAVAYTPSAVSQQLARLRAEDLIVARRDGKAIYYSIADPRAHQIIELVYELFCGPNAE